MEFRSFGAGIAIGALAVSVATIFLVVPQLKSTEEDTGNPNEIEAFLSIGGYIRDVSEDTLTISQCRLDECFENSEPRQNDIHIKLTRGAVLYNCGNPGDNSVADCVEGFRTGIVPIGTAVCANVRLIGGELYGGKIFVDEQLEFCNYQPRVRS